MVLFGFADVAERAARSADTHRAWVRVRARDPLGHVHADLRHRCSCARTKRASTERVKGVATGDGRRIILVARPRSAIPAEPDGSTEPRVNAPAAEAPYRRGPGAVCTTSAPPTRATPLAAINGDWPSEEPRRCASARRARERLRGRSGQSFRAASNISSHSGVDRVVAAVGGEFEHAPEGGTLAIARSIQAS